MNDSKNNSPQVLTGLVAASVILLIIAVILLVVLINKNDDNLNENRAAENTISNEAEALPDDTDETPAVTTPKPKPKPKGSCEDVTSYDYNWDNDMLCTRPDGSTFYTDYAGAEAYENSQ